MSETPTFDQLAAMSIHRPHQSESLRREIRALEWALQGRSEHNGQPMPQFANGGGDDVGNRDYIQESLSRTKRLYENHAAEAWADRFNGYEKNKLFQELKTAEVDIVEGMPTHEMMQDPSSSNVDWWRAWHKAKVKRILSWRNGQRILDPRNDNENFGNVDRLRKHHLSGDDPRRYWSGFEQIAFTDQAEREIDQLSDAQYHVFLTLKAQKWADMNIMRKLGWTKPTYEAAMSKLRSSMQRLDLPEELGPDEAEPSVATEEDMEVSVPVDEPADPLPRAQKAAAPMLASSEWRRLLADHAITHKTAARYIYMNISTFKSRLEGRGRFTEKQAMQLMELIESKAPRSSAA
jgi:hypothetical protein